ncbi:hypothetical protein GmHk_08G022939 [Glycine max]|nr:hypothetical protein GmHk_08G022939 [Glycine max]
MCVSSTRYFLSTSLLLLFTVKPVCFFFLLCVNPFLSLLTSSSSSSSSSLLNYNSRKHVFIYAEKVEEHIKAAIFISKNPRVQVRKHKRLNFFGCSAFILFFGFSQYKSLHFFCVPEPSPTCSLLPMPSFLCFRPFLVRRWKNTLKLRFLSQKLHEYRFVRNDSVEGVEE